MSGRLSERLSKALRSDDPLYIGGVKLPNRLILGPMAGVSDMAYRRICHDMGAGLVCMEMVSAKAICYRNKKTEELTVIDEDEHPVSLQLFGSDPESMAKAVRMIEDTPYDILDINMGCPVPKVVGNGDGSALMKDPHRAKKVMKAVVSATDRPVTVKIRAGFDAGSINAPEIARIAEDSGIAAVAVHGRTRDQYYSGKADWTVIREVKDAVSIPVVGNGDLWTAEAVAEMYEETGCDAFMIARPAQGDPWIFKRILAASAGEETDEPDVDEMADMLLKHAGEEVKIKGEHIGIREMRKHAAWYTAGFPGSATLRRRINEIESIMELSSLIAEYKTTYKKEMAQTGSPDKRNP